MATHEERFRALLAEWNLQPTTYQETAELETHTVHLEAMRGNVDGYDGFVASFNFNEDGSFKNMGVWE